MVAVTVEQNSKRWLAAEGTGLVLLGIILVALNLRPAVTSLGALLDEVRAGLHLSGTMAGLVTTLPVLSFAAFGALTPALARRFGPHRILSSSVALLAAGLVARALTDSALVFFVTSALALAGIASANVLLPGLVKHHFPDKVGLVTGAYTMTLTLGALLAAATTVPVAHALGGWHAGLAIWAGVAAVAVLPWLFLRRRDRGLDSAAAARSAVRPSRTAIGWALAVYFGTQSLNAYVIMGWLPQIYRDSGFSANTAGLLVAGIMATGIPLAFFMPSLAARRPDQRIVVVALNACYAVAYLGLLLAPVQGVLVWTLLFGLGQGAFPLALAMIGLRSRTPEGTVALSAFAQSAGYLIAALGPMLVGTLYATTGGWTAPLLVLLAVVAVQGGAGLLAGRPRYLEDTALTHREDAAFSRKEPQ
ncbi:CynX/NimT family MFS transporter [Longispora albida]|uniref:CynX/NimT family MFS transporter n=1 Tax=Longispora albida TaxID=203523 RepID=UPI00037B1189|nr:MFS transporter [Longispora albida]